MKHLVFFAIAALALVLSGCADPSLTEEDFAEARASVAPGSPDATSHLPPAPSSRGGY